MKERLELIMQEQGNLTAYEFSKSLGFKRPDNLYKILEGSTKNPGVEFIKAVKKRYTQYAYDWILDGTGKKNMESNVQDFRMMENKDNRIIQLEKMVAERDAKLYRYESVIDSLTGNGKKLKGVSNFARLDFRLKTKIVNLTSDYALFVGANFDRNMKGDC